MHLMQEKLVLITVKLRSDKFKYERTNELSENNFEK